MDAVESNLKKGVITYKTMQNDFLFRLT